MNALYILSALGILTLGAEIFNFRKALYTLILLGLGGAIAATCLEWNQSLLHFGGMLHADNYSLTLIFVLLGTALLWLLSAHSSIRSHYTEHLSLILFAMAGAVVMVSFSNLVMLFLGIEIMSISMYILAGSKKESAASNEASLKYFLTGAFSTGFFLFGIALLYGVTGSFSVPGIAEAIQTKGLASPGMLLAGILLIMAGLAFKVAAFPFHFWAPDVYEGSPDIITSFMATVVKTASVGAFFKLFFLCFHHHPEAWQNTLWVIAALSILAGNMLAALQDNLKRMMAYSGIAHAGYMLIAIVALTKTSESSLLYYIIAYVPATLAAFAVVIFVAGNSNASISTIAGLGKRNPLAAGTMTIALLSLAGIPPASGFFGKYFLFTTALEQGHLWLVLIAVAGTLISVYYYFRIMHAMFLQHGPEEKIETSFSANAVFVLSSAGILVAGVFPDLILRWIR